MYYPALLVSLCAAAVAIVLVVKRNKQRNFSKDLDYVDIKRK